MEPKSMPKLIKNQCQNWYRKRSGKSWNFMFFRKGKTLILSAERRSVVQKQASRGFVRGECANGKFIKKTPKMRPKSVTKSMKNPCKIHARKRYVKNTENHQNWSRKGGQNRGKTSQKYMWKKDQKEDARPTLSRRTPVSPEHSLSKTSCGVGYMKGK